MSVAQAPQVDSAALRLLNAPLPELLAEYAVNVAVIEAEPGFTGGCRVRSDGSVLFYRPAGRPAVEWELTARAMLGRVLRVALPPLPAPFEVTEVAAVSA